VCRLRNPRIDSAVRQLLKAWRNYVASGFDAGLGRQYCFRYFSLLDLMLSAATDRIAHRNGLQSLRHVQPLFDLRFPHRCATVRCRGVGVL
jgi:hypothetical protein